MEISLVIPAHNEAQYIGACLESVRAQGADRFKEIIVVDNASTDATAEIAARYPGVRVIREDRKGLTKARQTGFIASSGEYVAYIDGDCRMPAGWCDKAQELIAAHPEAVSWSGPARYYDASVLWSIILAVGWWLTAPIMYRMIGYMVLGGNFVVRRSAVEVIGGFDPAIEFYGEDMTLARRLYAHGPTIFRMHFYILTSMRRFATEGYFRTNLKYVLNYWWPVVFGRPYTRAYTDVR